MYLDEGLFESLVFRESVQVLHDRPNNASARFAMETKKIKVSMFGMR